MPVVNVLPSANMSLSSAQLEPVTCFMKPEAHAETISARTSLHCWKGFFWPAKADAGSLDFSRYWYEFLSSSSTRWQSKTW